jgi:uncharacterized membrane protein
MQNSSSPGRSRIAPLLFTLCLASLIDVGTGWLLHQPYLSQRARVLIAFLPVPANLVLVALIVSTIRRLDEFLRQVHLEAVAIGFLLTGLAVFVYAYLQRAGAVPALNVGIVWVFMVLFYGVGYIVAARHYR